MSAHPPMSPEFSDEDLVGMLRTSERDEAMARLEERYGRRIHNFIQGMCRDQHLAQDVTQEVFQKLLLKHQLYRPGTNFRAWLFEVARNQTLSAMRARRRLPLPVSSLQGTDDLGEDLLAALPAPSIERELEADEFMDAFHAAVGDLPTHYRDVFDLCVREGLPYQQAGELLGLPTGTVAIRIMRARKRLYGALQRHLGRLRRPPACFQ